MKFGNKILEKLLDKYESSVEQWDKSKQSRIVRVNVEKDSLFNNYFGTESFRYRDDIEEEIEKIERNKFVQVNRDSSTNLIKYVALNKNELENIYKYLNRASKGEKENNDVYKLKKLMQKYQTSLICKNYLNELIKLISNHKSVLSYFKTQEELNEQLEMVIKIESNDKEILIRNFSKKYFSDSKLLERHSGKLLKLFNRFGNNNFGNNVDFFDNYNIVKNKTFAYFRGGMSFSINDEIIDLHKFNVDFSLSSDAIDKLKIKELSCGRIITIENLTTYNYYKNDNALIIYLGGFHNKSKNLLLTKLYNFNKNMEFYHMGDIDCGGFRILNSLRIKTGIDFKPLFMDIKTIEKYKNECQNLSENDKIALNKMLNDKLYSEHYEVINFMLKNNIKLEQESIVF